MKSILRILLLAAAFVAALPSLLSAQIYSAVDDFSFVSNPNGPWSYGYTANATSAFVPFTSPVMESGASQPLGGWSGPGYFPWVYRNVNPGTLNAGSTVFVSSELGLHPEHFGRWAAVRWVAPATGQYLLDFRFRDISNEVVASVDLAIRLNSSIFFSSALGGAVTSSGLDDQLLTLTVGDTVDFLVGAQGAYFYDHTGLSAVFTTVSPPTAPGAVPEPSTYALASLGLLALATLRRRASATRNH